MKSKVFSVLLRRPTAAGDYSCPDGEIGDINGGLTFAPQSDGAADSGTESDNPASLPEIEKDFTLSLPESPVVEFSLQKSILAGWHSNPDMFPSETVASSGETSRNWGENAMRLLDSFSSDAARQNLFVEPFFAIAALRLADGNHILPSVPVLLTPNSCAPLVAGEEDLSLTVMKMRIVAAVCALRCRITVPDSLKEWKGKVTHLDIFVSSPVALYPRQGSATGYHQAKTGNFSHCLDSSGTEGEHLLSDSTWPQAWIPDTPSGYSPFKALTATDGFFIISEIEIDHLTTSSEFKEIDFNCGGLTQLESQSPYIPGYAHLQGVKADCRSLFSGRATLCGLTLTVPAIPPLSSMSPRVSGMTGNGVVEAAAEVEMLKNGRIIRSMCRKGEKIEIGEGGFPRWLFYPDPDATRMIISTSAGTYTVRLHRHPSLHGAYYWCGGYDRMSLPEMGIGTSGTTLQPGFPESERRDIQSLPGAIWRSAEGCSLFFPDSLFMTPDVGRTIAVCRAFRSSGLVATTSPSAYAFTSQGIFLLKEADNGTFRDAGLMATYILADPSSIRMGGRVLEFISAEGELLRIEGTVVKKAAQMKADTTGATSAGKSVIISGTGDNSPGEFTTRPIKLGDAESLKRIAGVELRGTRLPPDLTLTLHGSIDMNRWEKIATGSDAIHGLWGPRLRFLKVTVGGCLPPGSTIEAIVFRTYISR